MIDPNRPIAQLVSEVCPNVELEFPRGQAEFPLATIRAINNSTEVVLGGKERYSSIIVQVDIWDNEPTRERCEQIACAVSDKFIAAGFRRQSSDPIKEDHLHRHSMTFHGVVDEETYMIYERS